MAPSLPRDISRCKRSSSTMEPLDASLNILPVSESDCAMLWNQYCDISNASQRTRRRCYGPVVATNFWSGTFEPNRRVNVDIMIRNKTIYVRVLDRDIFPGHLPLYLPNMAVPLEITPERLLEDINRSIPLQILDKQGRILGYCTVQVVWKNTSEDPEVSVVCMKERFSGKQAVPGQLQNGGKTIDVDTNENVSVRTHHSVRSFEVVLH